MERLFQAANLVSQMSNIFSTQGQKVGFLTFIPTVLHLQVMMIASL